VTDAVEPFILAVAQAELDDLTDRLTRTRWPEPETVEDWSQGVPRDYLREVCRYWADGYDWRRLEATLNGFGQFRTDLDGLGVHFLHVPSPEAGALPLVLTHGWPGSVVEFTKVIGPLTDPRSHGGDPADAFDVVCPSLPGYGWSDKPAAPGWKVDRIAGAWDQLMARLGYARYGAQGGDWGAGVTEAIGRLFADRCAGVHINLAQFRRPPDDEALSPDERAAVDALDEFQRWGTGYSAEQSTRPQTLGYGLADSPAGQAGWIIEKFQAWSDCDGHPENAFTRDEMLDNVSVYWLTNSGASSARLYWESFRRNRAAPVTAPAGISIFPKEIVRPARRWVEPRFADLRYWGTPARGGHFAAFEQPELFVTEVRNFFRVVR
jgi:pimeloyl-ACP methyl ester carboxylesterase